jgi:hypothetical protein
LTRPPWRSLMSGCGPAVRIDRSPAIGKTPFQSFRGRAPFGSLAVYTARTPLLARFRPQNAS